MAAVARSLPSLLAACCAIVLATAGASAQSRHPAFVDAAEVVPGLVVDMRYFGSDNFVGRRIDGYEEAICLLTRQAAVALAAVQRDLSAQGLGLKVFDCYRPVRAVAHFVRWARDLTDQRGKQEYYPELDKRVLFRDGYISARSGHSRGSTVDLTLVRVADNRPLEMGTTFDFFGPRSGRGTGALSTEAQANRQLLASAMARRGFRPYWKEWWHFTLAGEPFPDAYFDFPVR
ncbi:MAG TPA: M15 family metallopeptidase [Xanthobacteraceae bacterium]|jgi:D-alanyl-D-alanine dipeptidase